MSNGQQPERERRCWPGARGRGNGGGRGLFSRWRRARSEARHLDLIGLDVAGSSSPLRPRALLPLALATLLVALGVAALRIDLLRIRYALVDTIKEEQRLHGEQRALTARKRQLRDPIQLAGRAHELGFVRPKKLVDLPDDPALSGDSSSTVLADAGASATSTLLDRP